MPCRLQGGTVVNAEAEILADVLVKDGLIEAVQSDLQVICRYRSLRQLSR